jgi:hypothetical protein
MPALMQNAYSTDWVRMNMARKVSALLCTPWCAACCVVHPRADAETVLCGLPEECVDHCVIVQQQIMHSAVASTVGIGTMPCRTSCLCWFCCSS